MLTLSVYRYRVSGEDLIVTEDGDGVRGWGKVRSGGGGGSHTCRTQVRCWGTGGGDGGENGAG